MYTSVSAFACYIRVSEVLQWKSRKVFFFHVVADLVKQLLRSLSIKQGRKYDNPLSSREIKGFVEFHKLDLDEVLLPLEEFKTYNPLQTLLTSVSTNSSIVSLKSKHALARLQKIHQLPSHQLTVAVSYLTKLKRQQKYGSKEEISTCNVSLVRRFPMKRRNMKVEHLEYLDWHLKIIIVSMFLWTEYSENPSWWRDSIILSTPWLLDLRTALMERVLIARLDVYGENIRVVVPIDTEQFGRVMVVCVGAMMVGSIVITAKKGQQVRRTDELGYFKFGILPLFVLVDSQVGAQFFSFSNPAYSYGTMISSRMRVNL